MSNENLNSEDILFYNPISTRKILIVCKGNTCRSIIFHTIMQEYKGVNTELFSAGIDVLNKNIEENTKKILENNNLNPIKTITNKIYEYKDIYFDDLIIMEDKISIPEYINYKRMIRLNIEDPFDKDLIFYDKVFKEIKKEVLNITL